MDWMALSEVRRGLLLVWLQAGLHVVRGHRVPLEKTKLGRRCRVTVEELLETVQLWATPPLMAYCPGR